VSEISFADRIRERYPEGLTAVFAVGGTRTTYILEQNRHKDDPGKIDDFSEHGRYLLHRYWDLYNNFFALGGQNLIVTMFSFRGFHNRGGQYAELIAQEITRLIGDESIAYYQSHGVDPYFAGLEPMLLLPEDHSAHQVARKLKTFVDNWDYRDGRYKLVMEMASMPLYTFLQADLSMTTETQIALESAIETNSENLEDVYRVMYRYYARAAYGTDIPMPHFYLGTNKSGDLKWRSPMPLSLSGGDYIRLFYTPYPTLFITRDTLQVILEDLAFKKRFFSDKTDYAGQYTRELVQAEYERVMALRDDPSIVLGVSRRGYNPDDE
jgi:hypothetical protein